MDVYCQKTHEGSLIYRLYVDNDLLTERTWIWPAYETYLHEIMEIDVDTGKHRVQLVNLNNNITFKNVRVNKQLVSKGDRLQEFEFTV